MFRGILHIVGGFIKYLAAAIIIAFSVSLSYMFFHEIAPVDMPWFTWAALGVTEIGLLCWLAVFMLQKHNDAHKAIAFVMVFVCMVAVLYTDAMELARLFHVTTLVSGLYYYAFIVLLLAHFLAFVIDLFVSYPAMHGGLQYAQSQIYVEEAQRPLLPRPQRAQPKEESTTGQMQAMNLSQVASIPVAAKEGASLLMQKGKDYIRNGRTVARVPGKMNTNTEGDTSTNGFPMDDNLEA